MISIMEAIEVSPCTKGRKKPVRPIGQRLFYTKNFHKLDRSLDHFIDSTERLNRGEKQVLRKLLFLRKREDATEVKVTISGLSQLLHINIKTARRNLKGLVAKGFLLPLGNVHEEHCNYAKKLYAFPVTFPGFDLARVFVKKGDKRKYQARMERKHHRQQNQQRIEAKKESAAGVEQESASQTRVTALKEVVEPQEAMEKNVITSPKTATFTCPTMPSLIACKTSDFPEEINISSVKIRKYSPPLASPAAVCKPIPFPEEPDKKLIEDFYCPELKEKFKKLLWRSRDRKRIKYLARFFNHVMDQYPHQFKTLQDRLFFAQEFNREHINNCHYEADGKRKIIKRLLWLIRFSAENCITPSYEKSMEYQLGWNRSRDPQYVLHNQMERYLAESRN